MQPNLQQDAQFNYSAKAQVMQKYLDAVGSRHRAAIDRRARRQHPDLAGIRRFRSS